VSRSSPSWFASPRAAVAATCAAVALVTGATSASAAGLYFSDRGVRPVGRAGAFVAGADDLGAIWYNPAGIAFAGNSVLVDASWLHFGSTFQRRTFVRDPATGDETIQGSNYYPEVRGTSPLLPLPTLAISNNFGLEKFNFAFGMYAPYSALTTYPEEQLPFNGRTVPAPQRYSLITLNGSALAVLALHASYMPSEHVAIGAGFQVLTGTFVSKLAFSACPPDRLICNTEQPDYDSYGQLKVGTIVAPSGNFGIIGIVSDSPDMEVRLGASVQLPFWIDAPAKTRLQLPTAAPFRDAYVRGEDARVTFRLPPILRTGIETRFGSKKQTRLEAAFFYEAWSVHNEIAIKPAGDGIFLENVTGFPPSYQVGEMKQPRGFRDTFSLHGGLEHLFTIGGYDLMIRGGASYERSAVPPAYLSVLTVDLDKVTLALGGSLFVGEKKQLRLDLLIAHTFGFTTDVDPREAAIGRVQVVRANPVDERNQIKVNGGRYTAQADIVGVGLNWKY
jgi:long-chain fatty acid transport protein